MQSLLNVVAIYVPWALNMKCTIESDVTPSSLVEVYRCIGKTYCFHLQE
jgi:hypothetical protein